VVVVPHSGEVVVGVAMEEVSVVMDAPIGGVVAQVDDEAVVRLVDAVHCRDVTEASVVPLPAVDLDHTVVHPPVVHLVEVHLSDVDLRHLDGAVHVASRLPDQFLGVGAETEIRSAKNDVLKQSAVSFRF